MHQGEKLSKEFFTRDVLEVAPELPGKLLAFMQSDGSVKRFMITEVEAYRGIEDLACHASKGRTKRTEVMYQEGGCLYIYFIYGMYWMLNIVTGEKDNPQAVLIRGIEGYEGPGRLTKSLGIDRSYYGEDITQSERIWFEDSGKINVVNIGPRIGIDYAGEYWRERPWRFFL